MGSEIVCMPEIEGAGEVVEYCVELGAHVALGEPLLIVESDKASMEVPSPFEGVVDEWLVTLGARVDTGAVLVALLEKTSIEKTEYEQIIRSDLNEPVSGNAKDSTLLTIYMPDAGGDGEVVEYLVKPGEHFSQGDPFLLVESDKASMEVPAPVSGEMVSSLLDAGSIVSEGDALATISLLSNVTEVGSYETEPLKGIEQADNAVSTQKRMLSTQKNAKPLNNFSTQESKAQVYSGPAARKLARELGVMLEDVIGTGPKGRILKDDIKAFVKEKQNKKEAVAQGSGIPKIPEQDFTRFGDIDVQDMSNIAKATSVHMTCCWLNIPHATLFDETDITDLEAFRGSIKPELFGLNKRPTILPFIVMVVAKALRQYPLFNSSISADGTQILKKDYVNIGMAVDTPAGLVVPVIKDADTKSISALASEILELASKARDRQLSPQDMQGGCFTISSLGPAGGTGFTPIINAPEVAILGVAKASIKPVWDGEKFIPRKHLPLCLSFDHRVINGGDAGRFMATVNQSLSEIRHLLL